MPPGLSGRLRDGTRTLHVAAERNAFVQAMLHGRLSRAAYAALLRSLHVVYDALERGIAAHPGRPALAAAAHPGLARTARLARDLDVLAGPGWARSLAPVPTATAYAARLGALATDDPDRLLAHAWVRYMGDLAGGRHLGQAVSRSLALDATHGAAFHAFPDIADPDAFRADFRAALDALPLDEDAVSRLLDEASWAFGAHATLFAELLDAAAALPPAPGLQDGATDDFVAGGGKVGVAE